MLPVQLQKKVGRRSMLEFLFRRRKWKITSGDKCLYAGTSSNYLFQIVAELSESQEFSGECLAHCWSNRRNLLAFPFEWEQAVKVVKKTFDREPVSELLTKVEAGEEVSFAGLCFYFRAVYSKSELWELVRSTLQLELSEEPCPFLIFPPERSENSRWNYSRIKEVGIPFSLETGKTAPVDGKDTAYLCLYTGSDD